MANSIPAIGMDSTGASQYPQHNWDKSIILPRLQSLHASFLL